MHNLGKPSSIVLLAFGAMLCIASPSVASDAWPLRPVKLIVQVGPGTGVDIAARLYAERLAALWKQPVVIENRPGGGGLIAVGAFVHAHDDHVLLFGPAAPISVFPYLYDNIGYDPARDILPISRAAETYVGVTASATSKIGSIHEIEIRARQQPHHLNYHAAPGAFPTLFEGFLRSYGLDLVQIPYVQDNLAAADIESGRLDVMLSTVATVMPAIQAGKARLLAVTNRERAPFAPDVPTVTEAGCPELDFQGLVGFFGAPEIPAAARERIAADVRAIAANPEFAARFAAFAQSAQGSTAAEFAAAIEEQPTKIAGIIHEIGRPGD